MTNEEALRIAIEALQEKGIALGMDNPERDEIMQAQIRLQQMVTDEMVRA